jgi:hypothetical protein
MMELVEFIKLVVQWIVVPIAGAVWWVIKKQQDQEIKLAVIAAVHEANKIAHDREFKEMRESFKVVFAKLDNIEQALRK